MPRSSRPAAGWERVALAEEYGAIGVNTKDQSLDTAVATFTQGEGVDLVVDNIGTRDSVREGLSVLRPGGKLLLVGYLDETFEIPAMRFFKTEQEIIGCRGSTKQDLVDVVRLVQSGRITPVIGAHYRSNRSTRPRRASRPGDLVGRIVLTRCWTWFRNVRFGQGDFRVNNSCDPTPSPALPEQMRALVLTSPGKFEIQTVPVPRPGRARGAVQGGRGGDLRQRSGDHSRRPRRHLAARLSVHPRP